MLLEDIFGEAFAGLCDWWLVVEIWSEGLRVLCSMRRFEIVRMSRRRRVLYLEVLMDIAGLLIFVGTRL